MNTDLRKHDPSGPAATHAGPDGTDGLGGGTGGDPAGPADRSGTPGNAGGSGTPGGVGGGRTGAGGPSGPYGSGGSYAPPPPPPPARRLTRDPDHRTVAGVAAGLGRYTGIDPVIFRVIFVVSTIFGGVGIVLYAVGWLFLPEDGDTASPVDALVRRKGRSSVSVAFTVLLAVVACGALATAVSGRGDAITVLIVLTVAAVVLLRVGPRRTPGGAPPPIPAARAATLRELAETPSVLASHAERNLVADLAAAACGAGLLQLPEADERMAKAFAARTRGQLAELIADLPPAWVDEWELGRSDLVDSPPTAVAPTTWDEPRRRSLLGPITLFAAALAVGAALLVDAGTGADLSLTTVLGIGVGVIGLGLVVGTWYGRARWLVLPALPLALLMLGASIVPVDLHGGVGERTVYPSALGAVAGSYRLGVGDLAVDLENASFRSPVRTTATLGVGQLTVRVPRNVDLVLHGRVRLGSVDPGDGQPSDGGYDVRRTIVDDGPDGPGGGTLVVDASVDLGSLEVIRA